MQDELKGIKKEIGENGCILLGIQIALWLGLIVLCKTNAVLWNIAYWLKELAK